MFCLFGAVGLGYCEGPAEASGGVPKSRGTFFGVPIIRIIVFWGLY